MTSEETAARDSMNEAVLQQQYLRALSSFEGIVLSQIDVTNRLGDRLNYGIRAGLIILSVIAVSILILLLTLSSQVNKMSAVVGEMNGHFSSVSDQMTTITGHIGSMKGQVAHLPSLNAYLTNMNNDMSTIQNNMTQISGTMHNLHGEFNLVQVDVAEVDRTMGLITNQVQAMGAAMHRIARPARTINKFIPFP